MPIAAAARARHIARKISDGSAQVQEFLTVSAIIDWGAPEIGALARQIRGGCGDATAIAGATFGWVRDEIKHSIDYGLQPVACRASETLRLGSGLCYAKSHLLAALLRANGIAAGFCYQRLSVDGQGAPFCLHGFNAIHLPGHGWYRVDARGNKPGIEARFCPPLEALAFAPVLEGEHTFAGIWAEPLDIVIDALSRYRNNAELCLHLPDLDPDDPDLPKPAAVT
ncbi:MAG: transglutaminase family protein [Nevskia sp.]|nr:transglutaminase family protein [Nevskia sp.]